jgi:hypothetical protein
MRVLRFSQVAGLIDIGYFSGRLRNGRAMCQAAKTVEELDMERFLAAVLISAGLIGTANAAGHKVTWIDVTDRYSCVMFELDNGTSWYGIPRSNTGFVQQFELLHQAYLSGQPIELDWAPSGKCDDGANKVQGVMLGVQH